MFEVNLLQARKPQKRNCEFLRAKLIDTHSAAETAFCEHKLM